MTWIATDVHRAEPDQPAQERAALQGWLDYHRATLLFKCQGLTGEQLVLRTAEPSTLSLLGLVRHMADVERAWFRRRLAGEADLPNLYWSDEHPDGNTLDLRWIYLHMIEEYARHNGHADILRERLDGVTGD